MLQAIRTWGVRHLAPSRAAEGSTPSSIFIEVCTISCLKILQMTRGNASLVTCDAVLELGMSQSLQCPNRCGPLQTERHETCGMLGQK